ncbi:MAG: TatD family hydrolase [Aigarchaeota archaeon]|nr:TatD family hydrolase [Aigarchaeota archaeon]MCX8192901.1 TatD family hydrolase [Nitrososphaeria archaeon]MDW7986454.1 TatD family hydrolase [Nitrososphaerota archaeon]
MIVDVHCHLTDRVFEGRLEEVLEDARRAGVKILVTSGLGFEDSVKVLKISDYVTVYPSLGIMPYDIEGYRDVIDLIEENADKIVAIGEVGLDYHINVTVDRELQKKVFLEFIELSKSLDLPLIVHSRSAGKYALEMLLNNKAEKVIMHAFDGSSSHIEEPVKRGFFFSIPPSIARSNQKQKLVKKLPLENILIESDSPALSPTLGEVNTPSNARVSVMWISRLKEITIERVEEITSENAFKILRLRRV